MKAPETVLDPADGLWHYVIDGVLSEVGYKSRAEAHVAGRDAVIASSG
ncbi:MAG: hypothetical protein M3P43_13310 [Actinomycetota bacterium]|nr:hypothetical protein [Actinomycetota bacterium]